MNRKVILLHRLLIGANILMLGASLVYYLIMWNTLPREIGVHFDGDGGYNVTDSKLYGFYPHVVGGIITAGIVLAGRLIQKRSTGLRLTEKGETLFRAELLMTLDLFLFIWSSMFSIWSVCVTRQIPLDLRLIGICAEIFGVLVLIGIALQIFTCIRYRTKEEKTPGKGLSHRLCRLIPWLLTGGGIWMLIECYNRYPGDMELYFKDEYRGLAYFANADAFLDKRLLIIPHVTVILLLIIWEFIGRRAEKAGKTRLVTLTDRAKLICGCFFFWWNLLLESEQAVGIVSVCLFALLCAVSVAAFATGSRNDRKLSVSADDVQQ